MNFKTRGGRNVAATEPRPTVRGILAATANRLPRPGRGVAEAEQAAREARPIAL